MEEFDDHIELLVGMIETHNLHHCIPNNSPARLKSQAYYLVLHYHRLPELLEDVEIFAPLLEEQRKKNCVEDPDYYYGIHMKMRSSMIAIVRILLRYFSL